MINSKFWLKKKVLRTGHTGFKGGWLSIWMNMMGAKVAGYSINPISQKNLFESAKLKNATAPGSALAFSSLPHSIQSVFS